MYTNLSTQDAAKYAAGKAAVDRYAHEGALLGLGSGTTSAWFVRALGERVAEGLNVVGVPTSNATRELAESLSIPLADLNSLDRKLEVTIDGPDEIDSDGDMIKGGGACLLWERIVAHASEKMVCIADSSKLKQKLGAFPLPIEVIPFGWRSTERAIKELFAELGYHNFPLTLRTEGDQTVVTDSGNFILDAHLEELREKDTVDTHLNWIPGVVENGLFVSVAKELIIATPEGDVEIVDLADHTTPRKLGQWARV